MNKYNKKFRGIDNVIWDYDQINMHRKYMTISEPVAINIFEFWYNIFMIAAFIKPPPPPKKKMLLLPKKGVKDQYLLVLPMLFWSYSCSFSCTIVYCSSSDLLVDPTSFFSCALPFCFDLMMKMKMRVNLQFLQRDWKKKTISAGVKWIT